MALRPVVAGARLTEDEVVWPLELAAHRWPGTHRVHGARHAVAAVRFSAVLVGNHVAELGSDLLAALESGLPVGAESSAWSLSMAWR